MKYKVILLIIMLPALLTTGCWSGHETNSLAFAMAVGIDKGQENKLMVTIQTVNPGALASKTQTNATPIVIYSETGADMPEIIRKLTKQVSRKIYFSHVRMIVFSEEIARNGISDYLDYFMRNPEFRTDFYISIAKENTARYLLSLLSHVESVPSIKIFNILKNSEMLWSETKTVRILELVNSIISDGKEPVLAAIETHITGEKQQTMDILTKTTTNKEIILGNLGIFKDDKLIGWFNEEAMKGFNYITGNVESSVGYVNCEDGGKISVEVLSSDSKSKIFLLNGKPAVNVEVDVEGMIEGVECKMDISKEDSLKMLNQLVEKKIYDLCMSAIKKAQNEYKSDIFGFGEAIYKAYPKLWDNLKSDWENQFVVLPVKVKVHADIKLFGQVGQPIFFKGK